MIKALPQVNLGPEKPTMIQSINLGAGSWAQRSIAVSKNVRLCLPNAPNRLPKLAHLCAFFHAEKKGGDFPGYPGKKRPVPSFAVRSKGI
ncbi:hypothetical protein Q3G72_024901 [Acer saccharum]|nr:hypothetical protein Q3G72_024901 [Acer saccharum]